MNGVKARRALGRRIRQATGLPLPVAMLAAKIIRQGRLAETSMGVVLPGTIRQQVEKAITSTYTHGCKCCGWHVNFSPHDGCERCVWHVNFFLNGPRGQFAI